MTKKKPVRREEGAMRIKDTLIERGQQEVVRLEVGQLPSNNKISIRAHVFRSRVAGPTLLLLGGVHGDEINGVEIVRQALAAGFLGRLQRGSVIAIPVLNVYGLINFSRDAPDGKDVNRSFPGSSSGSVASRVASVLTKHILPLVDYGLDFHTGSSNNYNYPQIRYTPGDTKATELAQAFAAPVTLAYGNTAKTLRKHAHSMGKPILVFEGGENLRYDGLSIQKALEGIQRVLHAEQMLTTAPPPPPAKKHFVKSTWTRARKAGLFQWMKNSGKYVKKGEPIGFINDPHGIRPTYYILSKRDGYIIAHNNNPVVNQGDALFHIAYTG